MYTKNGNNGQGSPSAPQSWSIWGMTKMKVVPMVVFLALWMFLLPSNSQGTDNGKSDRQINPNVNQPISIQKLTLAECIDLALKNNRIRKISKASLEIADAQYKQALSSFWPQLTLTSTATRMEAAPLFVFPSQPLPLGDAAAPSGRG
jgi:outer membrane protein TolC